MRTHQMSALLCIQSYAGARDRVHWLWPGLQASGLDILGTCPANSVHDWPIGCKFQPLIGEEDGWLTKKFLERWIQLWEHLISEPKYLEYDSFLVTPFDVLFLKPAPPHPGGLVTHLAGFKLNQGETANTFYHPPWWADRVSAKIIAEHGRNLIRAQQWELNAPDVFLGRIIEETKLAWSDANVFSVNSGMMNDCLPSAIAAAEAGCWFIHGIANQDQMIKLVSVSNGGNVKT